MGWRVAAFLAIFAGLAVPASAKSYSADRFDVRVRLLPGGAMDVTETVVFRFEEGTFRTVHREIPRRRTDGIEVLRAEMDARELPFGTGPGYVEVTRNSGLRVRWHFAPVSNATHTFTLSYRVHGAVRHESDADVLEWVLLPREHDYTIRSSTIDVVGPRPLVPPAIETHRTESARVERAGDAIRIVATGIATNGRIQAQLRFPPASLLASAPEWQQKIERADALAPRWTAGAVTVGIVGLLVLWMLRQGYDAPRRDYPSPEGISQPPDTLPPAIAGALAANGRVSLEHAMATLFSLADRGALTIKEEPRKFGQRVFTLERHRVDRAFAPHERIAFETAFSGKHELDAATTVSKARTRLMRRLGAFKRTVREEMAAQGLLDRDRQHVYARFGWVALGILIVGVLTFIALVFLVDEFRGWPLLIPGAMMAVAVTGFIFQASITPLSNEGVRRRDRWGAYKKHLKTVADHQVHLPSESPAHLLPIAVTLGLASAWAKFVKSHPSGAPAWFRAISITDDNGAFPALIAASGAGAGGHGGGGAGSAGGGGSSGAG